MKSGIIFGIIGAIAAGTGIAMLKLYSDHKEKQIEILSDSGVKVEVDKKIVDEAIENRVNYIVKREVDASATLAVNKIRSDIRSEVKDAVNTAYSDLKNDVKKEIEKQVGEVDITEIRKEVISKAKDRAAEKFDSDLAEILENYNRDLDNVSKIYASIAKKFDKDKDENKNISLNFV